MVRVGPTEQVTPTGLKNKKTWWDRLAINRSPPDGVSQPQSQRLENVFLIVLDFILLEKPHVLVTKASPGVVPFLIADVIDDAGELRMAVGESAKTFLPAKAAQHPPFAVYEIGRAILHVAHHLRQGHRRLEPDQQVGVVWHAMHGQQLLLTLPHDAGHELVQLLLVLLLNQVLAPLDGKNDLKVNL